MLLLVDFFKQLFRSRGGHTKCQTNDSQLLNFAKYAELQFTVKFNEPKLSSMLCHKLSEIFVYLYLVIFNCCNQN